MTLPAVAQAVGVLWAAAGLVWAIGTWCPVPGDRPKGWPWGAPLVLPMLVLLALSWLVAAAMHVVTRGRDA